TTSLCVVGVVLVFGFCYLLLVWSGDGGVAPPPRSPAGGCAAAPVGGRRASGAPAGHSRGRRAPAPSRRRRRGRVPRRPCVAGQTSGTVGLAGGLTDPAATLVLDGTIEWPDQPAIAFETRAFADADAVRVEVFEARSGPSEAEGALTIDLERDLFDGRFQARA